MITRPTSSRLLESVRDELKRTVVPLAGDDLELQGRLGMIDSILASVAIRVEHEWVWLLEEIGEMQQVGQAVVDAGADAEGRVQAALLRLVEGRSDGPTDLEGLRTEYDLAGEVLSCAIEAALPVGGELRQQVDAVLGRRIAREAEIRGEFSLAGRA